MAPDVNFEGPRCRRTASDLFSKVLGAEDQLWTFISKVLDAKEWLRTLISKVQNAEGMFWTHLKVLFEGKGSRNKFWTSISKVKEAKTSSGLPYRR
ncbi:unnamed protein product [Rhizophagus irregularis]|nr:unnamed protein product [Rhizophagus irregularis]